MTVEIAAVLIDAAYQLGAELSAALTLALVLVLLLRSPLRRMAGAGHAYCLWLAIPAAVVGVLLPDLQVRPAAMVQAIHTAAAAAVPDLPPARGSALALAALAWGAGALLMAAWFWCAHVRFVRSLGVITQRDDIFFSASRQAGPASLGLWRPRLIVPADFKTRYTDAEQALIIRHEQVHAERHDAVANLVQVGLQCLFWFHPLVHWAAVGFRADQELACDAAVLRSRRGQARAYAQALLKSHTFSTAAPATVACHWQSNHPIKERIMSLKQGQIGKTRRLAGRLAVLSLVLGAGAASMLARADVTAAPAAVSPAAVSTAAVSTAAVSTAAVYDVAMTLATDGAKSSPRVLARSGEAFAIASEQDGVTWRTQLTIDKAGAADTVRVAGQIERGTATFARPTLVGRLGETVRVKVSDADGHDYDLTMVVREVPARPAGQ